MADGSNSQALSAPDSGWRPATVALILLAASCFLLNHCHQPPAPLGLGASPKKFSAQRAFQRMQDLLGDEAPHPIGTPANLEVRLNLLSQLRDLGLEPSPSPVKEWIQVPRSWVTDLVRPANVVVELPSSQPEAAAIVLACHYDSVGGGPGASDDAAAVAAVLEVTRALLLRPRLPRPVILLFTDGEELGLFGARRFVHHNPLAKKAGIILNFEARGTSGGSLLFETSRDNRWMIRQAARGLKYPMTSSAYVEVYRRMPNSSDLAVFMDRRIHGMNFAYIKNPKHYHTPLDNLANLDRRSLQHHGQNMLGMVNQLLDSDLENNAKAVGDAVYTDLFARWIIAWPAFFGPTLSGFVLLALVLALRRASRSNKWTWRALLKTLSCWLAINVSAVLLSLLGLWILKAAEAVPTWFPAEMQFDIWFLCLCGGLGAILPIFLPRVSPSLLFAVHGFMLALAAVVLSFTITGFSYLWLLPAATAALAALLTRHHQLCSRRLLFSCLAVGFATAVPWYPLILRLPLALGVLVAPVLGASIAMLLLPSAPLLVSLRPRFKFALAALCVTACAFCLLRSIQSPAYTADSPQQISFLFSEEAGSNEASLSILDYERPFPSSLVHGLQPTSLENSAFRPYGAHFRVPPAVQSAPEIRVEQTTPPEDAGTHHATLTISYPRDSEHLLIGIPEDLPEAEVEIYGQKIRMPPEARDGHRWIRLRGSTGAIGTDRANTRNGLRPELPGVDLVVKLSWRGASSYSLVLVSARGGLPDHLASLVEARAALPGCSAHLGDLSFAWQHILVGSP